MRDVFRPSHEPARTLYDAFEAEALKRNEREWGEWLAAEAQAVWVAARDYAQQHSLPVPDLDAVRDAQATAFGHTDFGAKWAYAVAELLCPTERSGSDG